MNFSDLVGKKFHFFGVDNNQFKLCQNVWEVFENPDDGYRSYMDTVEIVNSNSIFFKKPLATVKVSENLSLEDGYVLDDVEDGHRWLSFGTDHSDSYYPYFVFSYTPK